MRTALFLSAVSLGLLLSACGGTDVGRACTTDGDCQNGLTCNTTLPGGYCTKGCSIEGQTNECPGGSVCSSQAGALLCAAECTSQGDCRSNYQCNGVNVNGQTSTTVKSCRPK